jgi:hypothetical protein
MQWQNTVLECFGDCPLKRSVEDTYENKSRGPMNYCIDDIWSITKYQYAASRMPMLECGLSNVVPLQLTSPVILDLLISVGGMLSNPYERRAHTVNGGGASRLFARLVYYLTQCTSLRT